MKKFNFGLTTIVFAGTFLRFFKITSNYYFTGELGKELTYMRQFAISYTLPLTGMATSHEWLNYGPFYYWFMIPLFNLFNGNPFILFYSALFVSITGLIISYFIVKKIADEKTAILSTLIMSISPLVILQTRLSKLHVFFFILSPVLMLLLYFLWNGKRKWVFWAGLTFGLMFSFHFSQIPIIGVVALLFWLKKKIYGIADWIKFSLGVILPNITLLWMDKAIALWLPYRVVNIANKNPAETWQLLSEYLGKNIFWDSRLWIIGLAIFVFVFADYIIKNRYKLTKDFLPFYLVSSISLMLVANIIHGAPPIHYFLPIFTTVPILFAIYLGRFRFWPFLVTLVLIVNLISFNKDPIFYGKSEKDLSSVDFVPYSEQLGIADFIVAYSKGSAFSIDRIGPYDYFPENYSQNYKYLTIWKGGNLVEGSSNIYTIVEDPEKNQIYVKK